MPISKELLNHKIITILRITKIPAHTHLGIHASSNKQIPQRKWLRKHTRANSQDKQNIHAYFVPLKYKNPLCVAPRIPISNLTPDECKCLATLHRRCAVWHKLLPVGKFCKSKTAAFNHFSKILKKITKSCVLNQLFTNEGTKQTQITKTSFWTNFLNKWPQVLDNETNEIASHNLFFSFFVKKIFFSTHNLSLSKHLKHMKHFVASQHAGTLFCMYHTRKTSQTFKRQTFVIPIQFCDNQTHAYIPGTNKE